MKLKFRKYKQLSRNICETYWYPFESYSAKLIEDFFKCTTKVISGRIVLIFKSFLSKKVK